jgi:hypothetical protein
MARRGENKASLSSLAPLGGRARTARPDFMTSRRRPTHYAPLAGSLFAVSVALLLLAPVGQVGAARVHKAPFKDLEADTHTQIGPGVACAYYGLTALGINETTGVGGFSFADNISSCAPVTRGTLFSRIASIDPLVLPIHTLSNGTHTVTVRMHATYNQSVNLTPGICSPVSGANVSSCKEAAYSNLNATVQLVDRSVPNKFTTYMWGGNVSTDLFVRCAKSLCNSTSHQSSSLNISHNLSWVWVWKGNMTAWPWHVYWLNINIYASTNTYFTVRSASLSGMYGFAQLNSGTLGNYIQLISVRIS